MGINSEGIADTHESSFLNSRSDYYAPFLDTYFFPSLSSSNVPLEPKNISPESAEALDVQKRLSRLIVDPHSKRWSQMMRISPRMFRELRNNGGSRIRPFLRKDTVDGGFRMSYLPARKRPYYYTEPEGSEFLGGPGK